MKTMDAGTNTAPRRWRWHHATLRRLEAALTRKSAAESAALRTREVEREVDRSDADHDEHEFRAWLAQVARDETEHAEIREALVRLDGGSYGICEKTGQAIAPARLRSMPWARCA